MKKSVCILLIALAACHKDKEIADTPPPQSPGQPVMETLVQNLQLPWGLAYLPNGDLLFSERSNGKLNLLAKGQAGYITLATRPVNNSGEGGLLSLAIDPDFASNHFVYAYETTDSNRVQRFILLNNALAFDKTIVYGIPEGVNHDGGALKFGPDGYLYIGTGDVTQSSLAQNLNSLAGKILRVDRDGHPAPGNPFSNRIWSYGHRNVQGFSWTATGQMLATEHGPSGEFGWCCHDEINRILPGHNYGWPLALAGTETGTLTPPLVHSGTDTWAPSGCTYLGANAIWPNCLVVATLRGQRLIRFYLDAAGTAIISSKDTLQGQLNRLRNIIETPDHSLIFCTSNYASITPLLPGDDKIYRLYRQ